MEHLFHSRGIILKKHYPQRMRVSVIDETTGHVSIIPDHGKWASYAGPGAIVAYDARQRRESIFVNHLELLHIPTFQSEHEQFFVHHVLEICYTFLPTESGAELFAHVLCLVTDTSRIASCYEHQKLFIAQLLFFMGVYPPESGRLSICSSLHQSYDKLINTGWSSGQKSEIDIFIYQCLASHPHGKFLKTINFFSEINR